MKFIYKFVDVFQMHEARRVTRTMRMTSRKSATSGLPDEPEPNASLQTHLLLQWPTIVRLSFLQSFIFRRVLNLNINFLNRWV